jgi:hypothetical protein
LLARRLILLLILVDREVPRAEDHRTRRNLAGRLVVPRMAGVIRHRIRILPVLPVLPVIRAVEEVEATNDYNTFSNIHVVWNPRNNDAESSDGGRM